MRELWVVEFNQERPYRAPNGALRVFTEESRALEYLAQIREFPGIHEGVTFTVTRYVPEVSCD